MRVNAVSQYYWNQEVKRDYVSLLDNIRVTKIIDNQPVELYDKEGKIPSKQFLGREIDKEV